MEVFTLWVFTLKPFPALRSLAVMVRQVPNKKDVLCFARLPEVKKFALLSCIPWGSFFSYSWSFFITVKLLCLQSLKALIRRTFPL